MTLVFGSIEANKILQETRELEKRIANLQDEYDDALNDLEIAEHDLREAEDRVDEYQLEVNIIEAFAKKYGITLA